MKKLLFCLLILSACFYFSNSAYAQTKDVTQTQQSFGEFEGRYEFNPVKIKNFIVDLNVGENNSLKMKLSHRQERTFIYEGKDKFADSEFKGIKLSIVRGNENKIKGLLLENFHLDYYFDSNENVFSQLKEGDFSVNAKKLELPPPSVVGNTEFKIKGFPNARIVALAGSFNNWNQSKNICVWETESWVCRIDLKPGRYTYKFVVDGAWMIDPDNKEIEADEYGNRNSVVNVKADNK